MRAKGEQKQEITSLEAQESALPAQSNPEEQAARTGHKGQAKGGGQPRPVLSSRDHSEA